MELKDRYIHALLSHAEKKPGPAIHDPASIEDMKFALDFMKFRGINEASPSDVAAVAKVAEFYRNYYRKKEMLEDIQEDNLEDVHGDNSVVS